MVDPQNDATGWHRPFLFQVHQKNIFEFSLAVLFSSAGESAQVGGRLLSKNKQTPGMDVSPGLSLFVSV